MSGATIKLIMQIIDYLLLMALLTTSLVALYSVLMRWLRPPLPEYRETDKSNDVETGRASLARPNPPRRLAQAFSR